MATERTEQHSRQQGGTQKALKRRGLIAGAATLVVGIVAKQAAEPVAAVNFVVLANGELDTTNNNTTATTRVTTSGSAYAALAGHGVGSVYGVYGASDTGVGVYAGTSTLISAPNVTALGAFQGSSGSGGIAVVATTNGDNSFGVQATARGNNSIGVQGTGGAFAGMSGVGVKGIGGTNGGFGVEGHGSAVSATGVIGFGGAPNGQGTAGIGNGTGPGVVGVGGNFIASNNADGVQGFANGTGSGVFGAGGGASGSGVFGTSGSGNGVYGTTGGTGLVAGVYGTSGTAYGIIGNTTAPFYSGLTATTATPNCAALAATSTNPAAFAAYFTGFTYVQGNFAVSGNKSAAVMHPDGTRRLLYCVEAPEAWFEDFGTAKLVGGKAEVKLDADFAALVQTSDYHAFPVSHDATSKGLAVTAHKADGFTVQEHGGGTSSGSFSWRIVARRKDTPGKRLEKLVVPKFNLPDPDKLPKPPAPPKKP